MRKEARPLLVLLQVLSPLMPGLFCAVRRPSRLDAAGASVWGGGAMEEEDWDELWDDDCFDEKLEQLRVRRAATTGSPWPSEQ